MKQKVIRIILGALFFFKKDVKFNNELVIFLQSVGFFFYTVLREFLQYCVFQILLCIGNYNFAGVNNRIICSFFQYDSSLSIANFMSKPPPKLPHRPHLLHQFQTNIPCLAQIFTPIHPLSCTQTLHIFFL